MIDTDTQTAQPSNPQTHPRCGSSTACMQNISLPATCEEMAVPLECATARKERVQSSQSAGLQAAGQKQTVHGCTCKAGHVDSLSSQKCLWLHNTAGPSIGCTLLHGVSPCCVPARVQRRPVGIHMTERSAKAAMASRNRNSTLLDGAQGPA